MATGYISWGFPCRRGVRRVPQQHNRNRPVTHVISILLFLVQHGDKLRLRGKGVLNVRQGLKGDQYVEVSVVYPAALSERQVGGRGNASVGASAVGLGWVRVVVQCAGCTDINRMRASSATVADMAPRLPHAASLFANSLRSFLTSAEGAASGVPGRGGEKGEGPHIALQLQMS